MKLQIKSKGETRKMISDPYKVLGVSPAASDEEITQAYRRMAKRYHPDLNHGDAEAAKK